LLGVAGAYDLEVVVRRRSADDWTGRFTLQAALPAAAPAPTVPDVAGAGDPWR